MHAILRASLSSHRGRRSHVLATLSIALLVAATPVLAQWSTQSPVPTHLDVRGVATPTPSHVFIATEDDFFDAGGALFESSDGGSTWTQLAVPDSLGGPLNGIFFFDDQRGWAFGNVNYRTTNGGSTWAQLPFLGSTYFMEFYTATFGLAAGNFGHQVSDDGGLTWSASPNDISDLDFASDQLGLGVASTGIYRTTDGGATFGLVHAGDAVAVAFSSATTAVAIVDGAFVYSTDGGASWTTGDSAVGRSRLTAVSTDVVLAWGRSGTLPDFDDRILRSVDGGQSWIDLGEPLAAGVLAFATPGAPTVVASDLEGNLFRSTNTGQDWAQTFTSPGPMPSFLSSARPAFSDASTGYFGYGAGFVIKTIDGGATWTQISSGTGESLFDVDRFASGDLIAVGDHGALLTSSGTSPWRLREVPTTRAIRAVQTLGGQEAVAVDQEGRIHTSTDAGATWTAAPTAPVGLDAKDLDFVSLLDGWVTGGGPIGSALFHTTDGGSSWAAVPGFGGAYVAVDFEGVNGWAANVGGRFYRTADGGANWIQGDLPGSPLQITDMDFFDASVGYAVGWWGYAARSADGGATWEVLTTPSNAVHLTDLYLLGPDELWVTTAHDVVYYSVTGGLTWSVMDVGSAGTGSFSAIAATAGGEAWTVGTQGFIEHFAGPPPPPLNRPPDTSFDFLATGLTVDFTDTSIDVDGFVASWLWDFGDGMSSTEQHPSHTYSTADTYIVTLTATDDDGDSGNAVRFVVAQPGPGGTFGDFTEVTPLDPLFVTPQNEDFWVTTTAPADYDSDGDLDVAVLGYYVIYGESAVDRLVLIRNDGPVSPTEWEFAYVDVPLGTLSAGASDLAWGDVDGDGDQDLAVGTDGQSALYRNDGGVLVMTDTVLPDYWEDNDQADFDLRSISWTDYDNDGDLDLLLPSVFDDTTFTYRTALLRNDGPNGTGGWSFTEAHSPFDPTLHAQSTWADHDGDQDLDLLLVNLAPLTGDGFIRRYRNDGNGTFVGEDILGALTVEHGEAHWGDYDEDGDLDILVAGHIKEIDGSFSQTLRIYRNDAETYVPLEVIACVPCEGWFDLTAATWADYDTDGDVDILLAGTYNSGSQIEGRAKIYANNGGVFLDSGVELPAPRASGSRGGTFSWLDLDGDLDLDYFIAGQYFVPGGNGLVEAQMHAYRNDSAGQNVAPTAPAGLSADTSGTSGTVLLQWSPASDDHTLTSALTYDLQIHRDGSTGVTPHRLPEPGSLGAAGEWSLSNLPDGFYTWTLRAVDSAYNGGPTAEGTFTVGATASEPHDDLPRAYALEPSYPNPFNPVTTLRFALPLESRVELTIHDARGRRVARLLDETMSPGRHEIPWNASGLASGAYFVRLWTEAFSQTQRVVLLK